ncbi:hypothetical protein H7I01_16420, partial [Mycobacterium palustre]|nr:hypothetical protein [Mycobacterium palustre]
AHAAWRGAGAVTEQDVRVAAELALPHRRRRDPFDDPGIDRDQLDEALARAGGDDPPPEPEPDPPGGGNGVDPVDAQPDSKPHTATRPSAPPSQTFRTRALTVPGVGAGAPGRR